MMDPYQDVYHRHVHVSPQSLFSGVRTVTSQCQNFQYRGPMSTPSQNVPSKHDGSVPRHLPPSLPCEPAIPFCKFPDSDIPVTCQNFGHQFTDLWPLLARSKTVIKSRPIIKPQYQDMRDHHLDVSPQSLFQVSGQWHLSVRITSASSQTYDKSEPDSGQWQSPVETWWTRTRIFTTATSMWARNPFFKIPGGDMPVPEFPAPVNGPTVKFHFKAPLVLSPPGYKPIYLPATILFRI